MWDWSGSKTPPPVRSRDDAGNDAQNQGNMPVRNEARPVPVYRDARAFRTLPPTAPASAYPDPLDIPDPQAVYSTMPPPVYPQRQSPFFQPSMIPPQAPPAFAQYPHQTAYGSGYPQAQSYPQPYIPQPQQYPAPYPAQAYVPLRPYPTNPPYIPQPYAAQPHQAPYSPLYSAQPAQAPYVQPDQSYAAQPAQPPYTQTEQSYSAQTAQAPYAQPDQSYAAQPAQPPYTQTEQPYSAQTVQSLYSSLKQTSYNPSAKTSQNHQKNLRQDQLTPSGDDKAVWEKQFQERGFVNMDLLEVDFVPLDPNWLMELRKAFKRTRRDFLKYVGYHHVNELLAAGMTEEAIKLVKKGKAPENFNVHIRVPFDYGGANSFSNLVLLQTHPFHTEIHRFIDMQTLSYPNLKPPKLFLPAPKGKVYFPGEIEISSGGASRHDRSVYAGFLESTFEMIAQRSSLGR